MCGIVGYFTPSIDLFEDHLREVTKSLEHRGPDAEGFFTEGQVGLGHRRLSIIDLSTAANQPMVSADQRYVIVYNGEVYNFREIAKDLKITLKTRSDTEVLVEAFAQWGQEFVHRLNGMYAIAIYDRTDKKLYLFRDRMGIKPLYYFWDGTHLVFSSELKGLLINPWIKKQVSFNREAVPYYLHLGFIPQPISIYKSIYKLENGHFLCVANGRLKKEVYWQPETELEQPVIHQMAEAKALLKKTLVGAVERNFISDVPVGVFLSGGIDSSLVTGIAQSLHEQPVKTFSIGFKEAPVDDAKYARSIAEYLQTDHHEFILSHQDSIQLLDGIYDIYDEPLAFNSALPSLLLASKTKEHVTVALSGDGGDELFLGYGHYTWAKRMRYLKNKTFRSIIAALLSTGNNRMKRAATLFRYGKGDDIITHIFSQEQYAFSREEIAKLLANTISDQITLKTTVDSTRQISAMEKQALFDLRYYLSDGMLLRMDYAAMKHSLEVRVPLLDHEVVSCALSISPKLKYQRGIQKFVLKEVLYDFIPKHYFDRPKWGFAIPLNKWLKNELAYLIDDNLNPSVIAQFGLLDIKEVDVLLNNYKRGHDYLFQRIWLLILLHKFLKDKKLAA